MRFSRQRIYGIGEFHAEAIYNIHIRACSIRDIILDLVLGSSLNIRYNTAVHAVRRLSILTKYNPKISILKTKI